MKNLTVVTTIFLFFYFVTFDTQAQNSLKFIDGIDLKTEGIAEFSPEIMPVIAPEVLKPTKNIISVATEKCLQIQFKYALLLNREVESIANLELFNFIEEWWNTRYVYGGDSKKGIDCSAFTGLLMGCVYAIRLPRTAKEQYKASKRISKDELIEGDLVFFNTKGGVSHVGTYLGDGYFVHASSSSGVTINNLDETYFSKRYVGAGRIEQEMDSYASAL